MVLLGAAASGPSLVGYGIAVLASLPFAYLVFDSPVMEDSSLGVKIGNFAATLAVRLFVVAAPLVLAAIKRTGGRWLRSRWCAAASSPTPSVPSPSPSSSTWCSCGPSS